LAPTSILREERPIVIQWDFTLPDGRLFTHRRHAALLESTREHLALFRAAPSRYRSGCSGGSLKLYFLCLRMLIRWMIQERLHHFADLDPLLVTDFTRAVKRRRGYTGPTIARRTLVHYYTVLVGLYRHRGAVADALQVDPFPGLSANGATARTPDREPAPYTPDAVAIPLIQGAIEFLSVAALPTLTARERFLQIYQESRRVHANHRDARRAGYLALRAVTIDTPRGPYRLDSAESVTRLIEFLYAACFVIIAYLVGPRVSEILHLQADCVQPWDEPNSGAALRTAMITGTIYKSESYHGRRHQWIAPPPAIQAITVLEALSAPHRARSGRRDLWLRPRSCSHGLGEWLPDSPLTLRVSDSKRANDRVNRFVQWLHVPRDRGRPWRFSSHQGRKTFARFIALRDRTALHALAQHLGHRDVRETDQGYVGTDYQLNEEIDAAVLDQSVSAWEQMLAAHSLAGRMGEEVLARRPRFRGARLKQKIRAYARVLAETGLTLGVCDWGYCVYREEFSACHGSATAPDPVRRDPSTCARCKNFAITDAHRPYWIEQVDRYERLLNDPALPTQTLKIARARLEEARSLLRSMGSPMKEKTRGRNPAQ
jgi:integrase